MTSCPYRRRGPSHVHHNTHTNIYITLHHNRNMRWQAAPVTSSHPGKARSAGGASRGPRRKRPPTCPNDSCCSNPHAMCPTSLVSQRGQQQMARRPQTHSLTRRTGAQRPHSGLGNGRPVCCRGGVIHRPHQPRHGAVIPGDAVHSSAHLPMPMRGICELPGTWGPCAATACTNTYQSPAQWCCGL